jgi:hypothetical protein
MIHLGMHLIFIIKEPLYEYRDLRQLAIVSYSYVIQRVPADKTTNPSQDEGPGT